MLDGKEVSIGYEPDKECTNLYVLCVLILLFFYGVNDL